MRKRITLLIAALMLALTMSFGSVAFAAIEEGNGNGHPNTTTSGKCPAGQKIQPRPLHIPITPLAQCGSPQGWGSQPPYTPYTHVVAREDRGKVSL
jgi:hypothetical protein